MSSGPAPTPQLVVVNARMHGAGFDIPPGRSEIGRQAGVAILLDDQDVSRRPGRGRVTVVESIAGIAHWLGPVAAGVLAPL